MSGARLRSRPFVVLGAFMLEDFPLHVQQRVQRILDAAAQRLLANQLDDDAISAAVPTSTASVRHHDSFSDDGS